MKMRYRLHWSSGSGPSPELKWQIWDWSLRAPVAHLENRALGRTICKLLNYADGHAPVQHVPEAAALARAPEE